MNSGCEYIKSQGVTFTPRGIREQTTKEQGTIIALAVFAYIPFKTYPNRDFGIELSSISILRDRP